MTFEKSFSWYLRYKRKRLNITRKQFVDMISAEEVTVYYLERLETGALSENHEAFKKVYDFVSGDIDEKMKLLAKEAKKSNK